ncbi:unnamed protein product [Rhodiola kirilowii]
MKVLLVVIGLLHLEWMMDRVRVHPRFLYINSNAMTHKRVLGGNLMKILLLIFALMSELLAFSLFSRICQNPDLQSRLE